MYGASFIKSALSILTVGSSFMLAFYYYTCYYGNITPLTAVDFNLAANTHTTISYPDLQNTSNSRTEMLDSYSNISKESYSNLEAEGHSTTEMLDSYSNVSYSNLEAEGHSSRTTAPSRAFSNNTVTAVSGIHGNESKLAHLSNSSNTVTATMTVSGIHGNRYSKEQVVDEEYGPHSINESMLQPCNSSDPYCTQYLLPTDWKYFNRCSHFKLHAPVKCRFMDAGNRRGPVVLTSFPGSGNTWVRGLLEQATGICTGSVYCDVAIRRAGLVGESVRSGSALVVKSHQRNPQWSKKRGFETNDNEQKNPKWSAGILIVRNPRDALISEWNRRCTVHSSNNGSSHVTSMGPEYFGENEGWQRFVFLHTKFWKAYLTEWFLSGHPVLLVRYEDLKTDTLREVKRMLDFLKFPYLEEELQRRMVTDFTLFRRARHSDFEHFTRGQRKYVWWIVSGMVKMLKEKYNGNALGIDEYLRD